MRTPPPLVVCMEFRGDDATLLRAAHATSKTGETLRDWCKRTLLEGSLEFLAHEGRLESAGRHDPNVVVGASAASPSDWPLEPEEARFLENEVRQAERAKLEREEREKRAAKKRERLDALAAEKREERALEKRLRKVGSQAEVVAPPE